MSLPSRLLGANPSIQVSTLLSGSLTTPSAKQAFVDPLSFESISSVNLTSNSSSIQITSIPTTYKHLQLRISCRDDRPSTNLNNMHIVVNGDTGANYSNHAIYGGLGTTPVAYGGANANRTDITYHPSASTTAGLFGNCIVDFQEYASTNQYKTIRIVGGYDGNGHGRVVLSTAVWVNTNAIDSITITNSSTNNFIAQSTFALYGIKG